MIQTMQVGKIPLPLCIVSRALPWKESAGLDRLSLHGQRRWRARGREREGEDSLGQEAPAKLSLPASQKGRAYCSHCRSGGEDRSPSSWRFETLSFKLVLSRAPIDFPFKESVGENQIWAKFIGLRWVVRAKPCSSPPLSWRPSVFVLCAWP